MDERHEAARALYLRALGRFPTSGPLPLGSVEQRDAAGGSLMLRLAIDHDGATQLDIIHRHLSEGKCVFTMTQSRPPRESTILRIVHFERGEWEKALLALH
jgi:hypothetical protein